MEKTATLNIRVNPQVKQEAEEVLSQLGVSMSTAIDVFLRQVSLTGGIPFSITLPRQNDSRLSEASLPDGSEFDKQESGDSKHEFKCVESKKEVIDAIRSVARLFPAIEKAYLFGSFARNMQTPDSDIDIRIVLDKGYSFSLRDLAHFSKRLGQMTGREIDVVSAKEIKNPNLAAAIEKDKELVYER